MALLNMNNNYVKITSIGPSEIQCCIYSSAEARQAEKNSTASSIIIEKYQELLELEKKNVYEKLKAEGLERVLVKGAKVSSESLNRALEFMTDFLTLAQEYNNYINDLHNHKGAQHSFDIMEKIFPDINTSISNIISIVNFEIDDASNLDTVYTKVKERKRFGETFDC